MIVRSIAVPSILAQWIAGWVGAFAGQALLGVLFTRPAVQSVLFDAERQSPWFITLARARDIPLSVAGLVVLGAAYGWLAVLLRARYPQDPPWWLGLRLAAVIWLVYWVPQEWFVYHTLLREPLALCLFELGLLASGSVATGCVTVGVLRWLERR